MLSRLRRVVAPGGFLGNPFIRVILVSNLFLQIGIWIRNFAVLLFVMEKTNNDSVAVSWLYVAEFTPILVFSVIGGAFADRWRPKKTMVICDLLSALSIFLILLALAGASWKAIFFTTFLSAILSQFSQPSGMKLFKQHVPEDQLQTGMALYQATISIFMIGGPAIGTLVFKSYGIYVSIALVGICFLISAALLLRLPADRSVEKNKQEANIWLELRDGFRYVVKRPILRLMGIAFGLGGIAVGLTQSLGIFIVVDRLHLDKEFYQWFAVVNVVAMVVGGAFVVGVSKKITPQVILAIGNLFCAITSIAIGLTTLLFWSLFFHFIRGFVLPFVQVGINTIVLKASEEAFVGRVNGIFGPIYMGMLVLMTSLSGWLNTFIPLAGMFIFSGIVFLVATGIISLMFRIKLSETRDTGAASSMSA